MPHLPDFPFRFGDLITGCLPFGGLRCPQPVPVAVAAGVAVASGSSSGGVSCIANASGSASVAEADVVALLPARDTSW